MWGAVRQGQARRGLGWINGSGASGYGKGCNQGYGANIKLNQVFMGTFSKVLRHEQSDTLLTTYDQHIGEKLMAARDEILDLRVSKDDVEIIDSL